MQTYHIKNYTKNISLKLKESIENQTNKGLDRVFITAPIVISHEIDENSPLYEISELV